MATILTPTYTHRYVCAYIHTQADVFSQTNKLIYKYTHRYTTKHTHTHTHTNINTYTQHVQHARKQLRWRRGNWCYCGARVEAQFSRARMNTEPLVNLQALGESKLEKREEKEIWKWGRVKKNISSMSSSGLPRIKLIILSIFLEP